MRRPPRILAAALVLALLGCAGEQEPPVPTVTRAAAEPITSPTSATPPTPTPTASVSGPDTSVVTVNPFTADGRLTGGFAVGGAGEPLICRDDHGSPHGVSTDTHACGPASLRAQACWRSPLAADAGEALYCLERPWSTSLVRRPATRIPLGTPRAADPLPAGLELADGSRWAYYGSAGWQDMPPGHEALYECVEGCRQWQALGHRTGAAPVDRSRPSWVVERLDADRGTAERVPVARAWFVASTILPEVYPTPTPEGFQTPTPTLTPMPPASPTAAPTR